MTFKMGQDHDWLQGCSEEEIELIKEAKQEQDEQREMQKQAMISQQQLKSQEMAAQVAVQKIELEAQAEMKVKQAEIAFEIEKQNNEANLKAQLMKQEFAYNQQLRNVSENALAFREGAREEAKKERISQQNTEQSQLINQRKNNLPPKNFESNEDSMDGFDLAEFDPR